MTQFLSSVDAVVARRIEAGHAHSAMASVSGVAVERIGGGWAIFHEPRSPVTQAIGMGIQGDIEPDCLDRLEAFYHSHSSPCVIDLATLADPNLVARIAERGYLVREISHVMARRIDAMPADVGDPRTSVEAAGPGEFPMWMRMMLQGFAGDEEIPEEQMAIMAAGNPWPEAFFGVWEGNRVATAAMDVHAGLATFFGDATLVGARGRGLQIALIRHRLQRAAALGCDLASASVLPGSVSHRNYERAGFQLIYGRIQISRQLSW